MAPTRMTWTAVDHGLARVTIGVVVVAVLGAVTAAYRLVAGDHLGALVMALAMMAALVMWAMLRTQQLATVRVDEQGINRKGRQGFSLAWDDITQAGFGHGLLASSTTYLILGGTGRRTGLTALGVAGSGFGSPLAAAPVDPRLQAELGALLAERGLLRTQAEWRTGR